MVTMWVLATLTHLVITGPKPLQLTVRPLISFAPVNLEIRVRVHAEEADRWISVRTDSGEFSRRSDWTIEPDRVLYSFWWRDLPKGEYVVVATVGHGDVVRASDRVSITVQGM